MYQHKRNVYLLKNAKSKRKLFSLKKKGDILVARYGNDVFFERYRDLDSHDVYQYNLKTNKVTKTKYDDAYYCNGKYLIINGNFHEGAPTPLRLYNMKTRKIITIAKNGLAGNAAIIRGNSVYYTEHYNKNMKSRLFRYDIKTKKKTMLKKNVPAATWLDQNHYYYQDSMARNIYVYNLKTGEKTTY